jgi:hypothetical protein
LGGARGRRKRDRRHDGFVPAVDRHTLEEFDPLGGAARNRAADRVQNLGVAQAKRDRFAAAQHRRNRARLRIERDDLAVEAERDNRVGQGGEHRFEEWITDARRAPLVARQGQTCRLGATCPDQRRQRDQETAGERRGGGERPGRPQAGEYDRCRRQRQARAPCPLEQTREPPALAVIGRRHAVRGERMCLLIVPTRS